MTDTVLENFTVILDPGSDYDDTKRSMNSRAASNPNSLIRLKLWRLIPGSA